MDVRKLRSLLVWGLVVGSVVLAAPAHTLTPSNLVRIAKITGANSINQTDVSYQVMATDLGIMWDNGQGKVMVAFGDTYGNGWGGSGAGPRTADWRCQVLAISSDTNPADGLHFETMIQDSAGHAKQLIPCKQQNGVEETVIPTAGVSVGSRHYIHYMSVKQWGAPGEWTTNYSRIAYSDNNGQSWTEDLNTQWSGSSKFALAAFVKHQGYVYMYGTPAGRFGNAYLARVPQNSVLTKSAYQYWDGAVWRTNDEAAAVPIVVAPVAELSVQYNSYYNRWIMTYLDTPRNQIVLRDAPALTGPWTGQKVLVQGSEYEALYGGHIHPWFNNGQDIYFTMTQWAPYNVYWMRARLNLDAKGENILSDPGFEDQASSSVAAPWSAAGTSGVDRGANLSHSGSNNGWLFGSSGWHNIYQRIAVAPQRDYRLTGWLRSSSTLSGGYFGVRTTSGQVIQERSFAYLGSYTRLVVDFNAGSNSVVDAFAGMWGPDADAWVQIDDLSVVDRDRVQDGGFETQPSNTISAPWAGEGTGSKGIDRGLGFARTGNNNGWINTSSTGWNAFTQRVPVTPNTNYRLTGWVRSSNNFTSGYFGVRPDGSNTPMAERPWGTLANPNGYNELTLDFNSLGNSHVTLFLGYHGPGTASWLRVDDIRLLEQ